jgi:hypothetical protein
MMIILLLLLSFFLLLLLLIITTIIITIIMINSHIAGKPQRSIGTDALERLPHPVHEILHHLGIAPLRVQQRTREDPRTGPFAALPANTHHHHTGSGATTG